MFRLLCLCLLILTLHSCSNEDAGEGGEVSPENVYFDYKISGDEDLGYVTAKLLFRKGARNKSPFRLTAPAGVTLDGQPIPADSTEMNGVYYEVSRPVAEFSGTHLIEYTGKNGKKYKEEFDFQPMTIDFETGSQVGPGDFQLRLGGLSDIDRVRVILLDTAAFSEGIERVMDATENGILVIDSLEMAGLRPGPIYLEVARERERSVLQGTKAGGRVSFYYGIKRQFVLTAP